MFFYYRAWERSLIIVWRTREFFLFNRKIRIFFLESFRWQEIKLFANSNVVAFFHLFHFHLFLSSTFLLFFSIQSEKCKLTEMLKCHAFFTFANEKFIWEIFVVFHSNLSSKEVWVDFVIARHPAVFTLPISSYYASLFAGKSSDFLFTFAYSPSSNRDNINQSPEATRETDWSEAENHATLLVVCLVSYQYSRLNKKTLKKKESLTTFAFLYDNEY